MCGWSLSFDQVKRRPCKGVLIRPKVEIKAAKSIEFLHSAVVLLVLSCSSKVKFKSPPSSQGVSSVGLIEMSSSLNAYLPTELDGP